MNVFISCRHKDWGIARQIAEQLRRRVVAHLEANSFITHTITSMKRNRLFSRSDMKIVTFS